MSTIITKNVQIGTSGTASNNFTWYQPASPDGTVRLGNGNSGAVTDVARFTSAGVFSFDSGYGSVATAYGCRAWVNFNGTGTVAIRASGNVSSITDVDVGRYRVNLTNAMPDKNYSVIGFMQPTVTNAGSDTFSNFNDCSTTVVDLVHYEDGTNRDSNFVSVAIFR